MQTCKKCGAEYDTKFCKPCKKLYLQEYRKKNKDKVYATEMAWRLANPDRVKATRKRWKDKNPAFNLEYYKKESEKIKLRAKIWYIANKDHAAAYKTEYYKIKPEVRANGKARRRVRIGAENLPYGTIPAQFKAQNGLCACCGEPLVKYHVDHIMPLALGGRNIPENIQLLLPKCNLRKGTKHPDVWRASLKANDQI